MSSLLSLSPYREALWTAGPSFTGTATSAGCAVADYASFAFVVAPNVQDPSMTGSFTYNVQAKLPGGLPDPVAASTPGTTTTGDIWATVESGTHSLADGVLVLRDLETPYREVRLVATFSSAPSHQVNAWLLLKKA
jgi:hypothetical protein